MYFHLTLPTFTTNLIRWTIPCSLSFSKLSLRLHLLIIILIMRMTFIALGRGTRYSMKGGKWKILPILMNIGYAVNGQITQTIVCTGQHLEWVENIRGFKSYYCNSKKIKQEATLLMVCRCAEIMANDA